MTTQNQIQAQESNIANEYLLEIEPEDLEPVSAIYFESEETDELKWESNKVQMIRIFERDINNFFGEGIVFKNFFNKELTGKPLIENDFFKKLIFLLTQAGIYVYKSDTRIVVYSSEIKINLDGDSHE